MRSAEIKTEKATVIIHGSADPVNLKKACLDYLRKVREGERENERNKKDL